MRLPHCIFVVLLLADVAVSADTEIVQPRSFGYVLGDVLEQRIKLPANVVNSQLDNLNQVERVNGWLERLSAKVEVDKSGQQWLKLRYQLINATTQGRLISLPALDIALSDGNEVAVEKWSVAISPLTPGDLADQFPQLYPDRPAQVSVSSSASRRLSYLLTGLIIGLSGWAGWWLWRESRDRVRLPFARAKHQLKQLPSDNLDDNEDAWLLLHHALNATAGHSVQSGNIEFLIEGQPWLASLQSTIEAFYAASSARFFAQNDVVPEFSLKTFCEALYRAEKAHGKGGARL